MKSGGLTLNRAVVERRIRSLKAQRDELANTATAQYELLVQSHLMDLERRFTREFYLLDAMGQAFVVTSRPVQGETHLNSWEIVGLPTYANHPRLNEAYTFLHNTLAKIEALCDEHEEDWGAVLGEIHVSK